MKLVGKQGWRALLFLFPLAAQADCNGASGSAIVPLVELYTSEGCSDCPAADAWLSARAASSDGSAHYLAFHVGYWNDIGWPDRFALDRNDQRQELRVRLSGKSVVYTPQVMVGNRTALDWRRNGPRSVDDAVRSLRAGAPGMELSMAVERTGATIGVSFGALRTATAPPGEAWIWIASYEDGLASTVAAGENAGRTLRHDRVVRNLLGPWRMDGDSIRQRTTLALPDGIDPDNAGLVLFAESAVDGTTLQSLQLPLAACAPASSG